MPKTFKLLISAVDRTEFHGAIENTNVCADLFAKSSSDSVYSNLTLPCFGVNLVWVHNKNKSTLQIFCFVQHTMAFEYCVGNNQTKKPNPK